MRVTLSPLLRIAILVFVVCPILAWAAVRPARVILPEVGSDIICVDAAVCVDDVSKLDSARALYTEAVSFVAQHIGGIEGRPKVVFCSTQACADHFGLGARSAVTVGQFGSVVGPRAWKPYYVRHELIHYEQYQRLGIVRVLRSPGWLIEGMAYGLSGDPRQTLSEPWQSYRQQFRAWYGAVPPDQLWSRAADL